MPVAVVTGASSGIGAALVRALQARGTHVVGLSRRGSEADEHETCDVADRAAVAAAAARILERHPALDLVVNNAGVGARGGFLTTSEETIEQVVDVNYLGSVWVVRALLPGLGRGSRIVNVVSVAGSVANGPYSASKHAQLAFSRSLTIELAPRGIAVHTVNPGYVETPGFPHRERFGIFARIVASPELVVRRTLAAIDHDRREIVVPRWYAPAVWLQALAPDTLARLRARAGR